MGTKNLGNVVGLYKGTTPPVEEDGVTEKRYILWAKEFPTIPVTYQVQYYDFFVGSWSPLVGVKESDFNYLKFLVFGTLNQVNLQPEFGRDTLIDVVRDLREGVGTLVDYVTTDQFNEKIAELVNGALAEYDTFGEVQEKLLELLQADTGFFTLSAQAAYATSVQNEFLTKIGFPAAQYKNNNYVMSGAGNPLLISDIMLNIFKNNGALTGNRELDLAGFTFTWKNLVDKSADASFDMLMGLNSSNQIGKTNGVQMFKKLPVNLTEAEKTSWKTSMNGGWTTASMSIADIFPPISRRSNSNIYLSVKGANLNLNPANFSVKICDNASTATVPIILATIPNNQVTLISPTDFAFYFNPITLGIPDGEFKLLIDNGVALYLSTYTFLVKDVVDLIDMANINWSTKVLDDVSTTSMQAGGSGFIFKPDASVKPLADVPETLFKVKTSQPLFNAGDDFYLSFNINFTNISGYNFSKHVIGLSTAPNFNILLDDFSNFIAMTLLGNQFTTSMAAGMGTTQVSQNVRVVFIKRGTYLVMQSWFVMNGTSFQQHTVTISDTNDFYFGGIFQNMNSTSKTLNISINSAYKF